MAIAMILLGSTVLGVALGVGAVYVSLVYSRDHGEGIF